MPGINPERPIFADITQVHDYPFGSPSACKKANVQPPAAAPAPTKRDTHLLAIQDYQDVADNNKWKQRIVQVDRANVSCLNRLRSFLLSFFDNFFDKKGALAGPLCNMSVKLSDLEGYLLKYDWKQLNDENRDTYVANIYKYDLNEARTDYVPRADCRDIDAGNLTVAAFRDKYRNDLEQVEKAYATVCEIAGRLLLRGKIRDQSSAHLWEAISNSFEHGQEVYHLNPATRAIHIKKMRVMQVPNEVSHRPGFLFNDDGKMREVSMEDIQINRLDGRKIVRMNLPDDTLINNVAEFTSIQIRNAKASARTHFGSQR